jgi:FdhD protein
MAKIPAAQELASMPKSPPILPEQTFECAGARIEDGVSEPVRDVLPVEAVLQILVNGDAYTTTIRTPGHDLELARGLLHTEGIVSDVDAKFQHTTLPDPETGLVACLDFVIEADAVEKEVSGRRSSLASSSCGFCGTRDPQELEPGGPPLVVSEEERLPATAFSAMIDEMQKHQPLFDASGGTHAAIAFDGSGAPLAAFEDIGRHNAVDKVVGALLIAGRLADARALAISGRCSYEIVFKAYQARIPFLMAVSAPSSLAVEMGERFGVSVAGFCRDKRATVYSRTGNVRF